MPPGSGDAREDSDYADRTPPPHLLAPALPRSGVPQTPANLPAEH